MQVVTFTATVAPRSPERRPEPVMFHNGHRRSNVLLAGEQHPARHGVVARLDRLRPALPPTPGTDTILACYNGVQSSFQAVARSRKRVIPAPIAVLSPDSLSFGNQQAGTTSGPQTVIRSTDDGTRAELPSLALHGRNSLNVTPAGSRARRVVW